MISRPLTDLESHFRFGENWADFAQIINEDHIASAVKSMQELAGDHLAGKSFLDIGSGSGLPALAAACLGVSHIVAVDIDPISVRTTEKLLSTHAPSLPLKTRTASIFDLRVADVGQFDVVHSWGVLHHTGNMWEAIERALQFVTPNGLIILAIYLKTPFCKFWAIEKKIYAHAPKIVQEVILIVYQFIFYLRLLLRGRNPWRHAVTYKRNRGMDLEHDFRDWLGGYPYESATPAEIESFMMTRGFKVMHIQNAEPSIGLLGSGCAEYVYRRSPN